MKVVQRTTPFTAVQYNGYGDCADVVYYRRYEKPLWPPCDMFDDGARPVVNTGSRWVFVDKGDWLLTDAEGRVTIVTDIGFQNNYVSIAE